MRRLRWPLGVALGVFVVLAVAAGAVFAFAGRFDFGPFVAGRLTASLGRKLTIGSLHIAPGRWLQVELDDLQLGNLPDGSQPIMASIPHATAEIDALSLLHGPPVLRRLSIDGAQLLLERNKAGLKNWKFAGEPQYPPPDPGERARFPTLLDARISGDIVFHTSRGHMLDTRIDTMRLTAAAADQPVRLTASGTYNAVPLTLDAGLASLDALRDTTKPYPADIRMASGDAVLTFKGTMTDPLQIDGAKGTLTLDTATIAPILRITGATAGFAASLHFQGAFTHDGLVWHLAQAAGALDDSTIRSADVTLTEGPPGQADMVDADLAFDRLDTNALLAGDTGGASDMSLAIDRDPGTLLTLKLSARDLAYGELHAADAALQGAIKPGLIAVDSLSFGYLGTPLRAHGQVAAVAGANNAPLGHATAELTLTGMDVQQLRKLLQSGPVPLLGRVDGQALLDATAATFGAAIKAGRLSAILGMNGGSVSRQIIELASTDARTLFRRAEGMTPLACAVAVIDMRDGIGTISPLRLRSADGTITGRGSFDLARRSIDITVASESRTTSIFALDVPMRVSGPIADPSIRPAALSAQGRAELSAGDAVERLLPALQPLARRSPCIGR
jgi:uncharacterized protein involved in outer membrane biogenesis